MSNFARTDTPTSPPRETNITERGRKRRRAGGYVWGVLAAVATVWVLAAARGGWWCAVPGVFVFQSALGFFQARERT